MGKKRRQRRETISRSTRTAPVRIGRGPVLGESMPASAAGWGRSRGGRTSQKTRETHPWLEAEKDASRVVAAIGLSLRGDPASLQDCYDDILDRDGRIAACSRTRALALTSRKWVIKPPQGWEQDTEAKAIASRCTDIIAAIEEWPLVIGWLAEGITRGYAVVEIVWGTNRDGWWVPAALKWKHQNRFAWDGDLRLCRREMGEAWPGTPLDEFKPDGWIVHVPTSGRAAYPMRNGLLLTAIPGAMVKRHGWKYWLKGSERYGIPLPIAKIPEGDDADDLQDKALEVMRKMNADWGAVFRGDVEIAKVEGTGEWTGELHRTMVEATNLEHAIILLGQNLTTEVQGGSFAAANAHNQVRGDLLAGDALEMGVTIRRHLLEAICRINGWTAAPVPLYEIQLAQPQPPTVEEVNAGLYTDDEHRAGKGHGPKADGSGSKYRIPAPAAGPGLTPAPSIEGGGGNAPDPFGRARQTVPTSGRTIPKGTMPTSSRGGRTNPS